MYNSKSYLNNEIDFSHSIVLDEMKSHMTKYYQIINTNITYYKECVRLFQLQSNTVLNDQVISSVNQTTYNKNELDSIKLIQYSKLSNSEIIKITGAPLELILAFRYIYSCIIILK